MFVHRGPQQILTDTGHHRWKSTVRSVSVLRAQGAKVRLTEWSAKHLPRKVVGPIGGASVRWVTRKWEERPLPRCPVFTSRFPLVPASGLQALQGQLQSTNSRGPVCGFSLRAWSAAELRVHCVLRLLALSFGQSLLSRAFKPAGAQGASVQPSGRLCSLLVS